MEDRTARKSARLGDEAAARVRNARRTRRKDRFVPIAVLLPEADEGVTGVEVDVRSAVKVFCTRERSRIRSLFVSSE